MPQSVSVPEKTLEHWSSQFVTYRYKTNVAQWWPARGEDINLGWLPSRPGKAVQLELKTTTVAGHGLHDVKVNLGQLWEYRQRPLGRQPFYAFPWPDGQWPGKLDEAAKAAGVHVTDLGFSRSGPGWWFADWMVLLTAAQVADVLGDELKDHGSKKRDKTARLVRFDLTGKETAWGSSGKAADPGVIRWRDFWPALDRCGQPGWPQLIRLPARLLKLDETRVQWRESYSSHEILALLQASMDIQREPLITLESNSNGLYQLLRTSDDPLAGSVDDEAADGEADEGTDHRLLAFINARAFVAG